MPPPPQQQQQQQQQQQEEEEEEEPTNRRWAALSRRSWVAAVATPVLLPRRSSAEGAGAVVSACDVGDAALAAEQQTTGAYESECMRLAERVFYRGGRALRVEQRLRQSSGAAARRTGVAVWESAAVLTDALQRRPELVSSVRGARVLCLGSGAGLDALTAHALGAAAVLSTDANDEALVLARDNAERYLTAARAEDARLAEAAATVAAQPEVKQEAEAGASPMPAVPLPVGSRALSVRRLRWGIETDADDALEALGGAPHVILGSDLTYNPNSWPALVDSVVYLLEAREEEEDDEREQAPGRQAGTGEPPSLVYATRSRSGAQGLFRELATASGLRFAKLEDDGGVEVWRVTLQ